jgi:putative alpha-1,2-mannosidase
MSAWYIFSAMGFYPVNPANGIYVFGSPIMDRVTVNLPDRRKFVIRAINNSKENIYIQAVELNGKKYTKAYIAHGDIVKGGTLTFHMGPAPNYTFGASAVDRPRSEVF